jgi:nitrogen fixation negative regulator NifL
MNHHLLVGALRHAIQRNHHEQELKHLAAIIESSDDGIGSGTLDGIIVSWNKGATRIYGYTAEEVVGRSMSMLVPPEQAGETAKILDTIRRGESLDHIETVRMRKDGARIFVSLSLSPIRNAIGAITSFSVIARDITVRKRAERLLREAEEKYRGIFENVLEGIFQTTPDGRILATNPAWARTLGYDSPEEMISSITNLAQQHYVDPQRRDEYKRLLNERGDAKGFEAQVYRKDRSVIWISLSARAIRDETGAVVRYEGFVQDITERKRSEERLRLQISALESAANGIVITESNGNITWVNAAFTTLTGYSKEEVIGQNPRLLRSGQHDAKFYRNLWQTITSGRVWHGEIVNKRKDNSLYTEEMTITPVRNLDGAVTHFIAMKQDVTRRKRMEEALQKSQRYNRRLFELSPLGLALCRMDGTLVDINEAYARILGRTMAETLSLSYWDITPKQYAAQEQEQLASLRSIGRYGPYEKEYIYKDGSLVPVRLSGVILERDGEEFIWSTVEDISERKRAEDQLKQALADTKKSRDELEAAQLQLIQAEKMDSIGRLAAGVAHEVKNPLATATMCVEYLSEALDPGNKQAPQVLKDLRQSIDRADHIVRGLVDFSTMTKLDSKEQDLNAIVEHSLTLVGHELKRGHIATEMVLSSELPTLLLDRIKIEQLLVNVFMNAIHAMPQGGILSVETLLKPNGTGGKTVVVVVEDTGHGIPADNLTKVFDPFFTTKPVGKGTGLGLSVTRAIMELHGGAIQVGNRPEGGAVVTITFKPTQGMPTYCSP